MDEHQRQLFLLVSFMTLLAAVTLFLFVYAPDPANVPSARIVLPESVNRGLNATVQGWNALFQDLSAAQQGLTGK
ncbi:MAG: hypothetical protein ABEJ91_02490 [Candidatus Nanohaloarchaea archaeon]